ncbi:MAG: hypothetical protein M0004_01430 [Actinomycetota bacterium]|nr:hypothetical protein [Actinomycetota bacterium]
MASLVARLCLVPGARYKLGLLRVSSKGNLEKLDDQRGTGVAVYEDLPDFAALKVMSIDVVAREWLPIRYCDLNPRASTTVFGWVGLVGQTVFVAVADSALEANLPPDPHDPAHIGRNAYIDLVAAAAIAGFASDIYAPFRSRWWRSDLYANQLMTAINRHLPGCTLWEGPKKVATAGAEKVITDVTGRTEGSGNAEAFAEQTFTKGIEHLEEGGQWDRRSSELPLGMERRRTTMADGTAKKALEVVESPLRAVAEEALKMRSRGASWEDVGALFKERGVPMCGTKAAGRTYAQFSSTRARTESARSYLLRHLRWYRTGEWTVRRTTKLPRDEVRGQQLSFDPTTGRRYKDVKVRLPWRPFLTEEEWAAFDTHEAKDAAARAASRKTGAAAHEHSALGAALQGVPSWGNGETLAPETATAYRWRVGGEIEATLRRQLVHRRMGIALIEVLRHLDRPLAATRFRSASEDPLAPLQRRVEGLEAAVQGQRASSTAADKELLDARTDGRDDSEVEHWREVGTEARREARRLEAELDRARADLELAREEVVEVEETRSAEVSELALFASILAEGEKRVDPLVTELCNRYGLAETLRCAWDDDPGARRRPDQRPGRPVRFTATASLPLLEGGIYEVPVSWTVEDSYAAPGDLALSEAILRAWATGASFEEIAASYPNLDAGRVRRRISERLRTAGVVVRDRRRSLLVLPVTAPKAILAALALRDPSLAAGYADALKRDITAAYLDGASAHADLWCDTAHLEEDRRVLEVLASPELGDDGMDIAALARNAGVSHQQVWSMNRRRLLEKVSLNAVRVKRCDFRAPRSKTACGGPMTIYTPAPEAGLICAQCWRPEGRAGQLGEEYTWHWIRDADGSYRVANAPIVSPGRRSRDRHLTIAEVGERLGLSDYAVRELDREEQLLPDSRAGINGGRLYRAERIDAIPPDARERWQARFGARAEYALLRTGDVAVLLECSVAVVRDLANDRVLRVAAVTAGNQRRFERADVDRVDPAIVAAYRLCPVGDAAKMFGLGASTLRQLANEGSVHFQTTPTGHRRFDLETLRGDLERLHLDGSEGNAIVSIGELARHESVRLSTGIVRQLTDRGVIRCAGRLGGKRRYRLADALADIAAGRRQSLIPPLGAGG